MHYTAALEYIQKHFGISDLKEVGIAKINDWNTKNTYSIDTEGNIIALNLRENNLQDISQIKTILGSITLRF